MADEEKSEFDKLKTSLAFMEEGGPYPLSRLPAYRGDVLGDLGDCIQRLEKTMHKSYDMSGAELDLLLMHMAVGGVAVTDACTKEEALKRFEFAWARGTEYRIAINADEKIRNEKRKDAIIAALKDSDMPEDMIEKLKQRLNDPKFDADLPQMINLDEEPSKAH